MSQRDASLRLVKDGLQRALRTLLAASLVALVVSGALMLVDGVGAPWWQLAAILEVGALLQAGLALLWRVAVDPSRWAPARLRPDETPFFTEVPLPPPVPMG